MNTEDIKKIVEALVISDLNASDKINGLRLLLEIHLCEQITGMAEDINYIKMLLTTGQAGIQTRKI